MAQLDNLKVDLGIAALDTTQDAVLNRLLAKSEEYILNRTNQTAIPTALLEAQIDLAIVYYNKRGIEGQTAHSEGGISRSFEDIPKDIEKRICRHRKLTPAATTPVV